MPGIPIHPPRPNLLPRCSLASKSQNDGQENVLHARNKLSASRRNHLDAANDCPTVDRLVHGDYRCGPDHAVVAWSLAGATPCATRSPTGYRGNLHLSH
jgi:hypothetical protein